LQRVENPPSLKCILPTGLVVADKSSNFKTLTSHLSYEITGLTL